MLRRFLVVKTDEEPTLRQTERNATQLEKCMSESVVNMVFRQKGLNPQQAFLQVCHKDESEKLLNDLYQNGYDEGPLASEDICVKEGQWLGFRFGLAT